MPNNGKISFLGELPSRACQPVPEKKCGYIGFRRGLNQKISQQLTFPDDYNASLHGINFRGSVYLVEIKNYFFKYVPEGTFLEKNT